VSDSIPGDPKAFPALRVLPTAPLLAEVIQHISHGQSVTEIYRNGGKKN
jgi:phosphoribosylpyrophosphate synthetase